MLLLGSALRSVLHLATAIYIIVSARIVFVHAFAAIEPISPLPVVTGTAVDDVAAMPSSECVCSAEAAYFVLAFLPGQPDWFVGARVQAAVGAAGQVICD